MISLGAQMHQFAKKLWPINRSITGEGVRKTLEEIRKILPQLEIKGIETGSKVFDWVVPKEWIIRDAYIIAPDGRKICNFLKNNLHIVSYSQPVDAVISFSDLKANLHYLENQPTAIPYITAYYGETWGFCISYEEFKGLKDGQYRVYIDSELIDGNLNYGELLIQGKEDKEIFLSTYVCHPSMANNELSGPVVTAYLAKWIQSLAKRQYSYRIIFIPETIGSISYLSLNYKEMKRSTIAGFNITCVGDNRSYSLLASKYGDKLVDKVARHVLSHIYPDYHEYDWSQRGSDERQYCAPLIDLPVTSIMRTKYGEYPEYHTSLDDLENVVTPDGLEGGYIAIKLAIEAVEKNYMPIVKNYCEPQLGKRGLYPNLSKKGDLSDELKLMMGILTYADGKNDLIDMAEKNKVPVWEMYGAIKKLKLAELIN